MYRSRDSGIQKNGYLGDACEVTGNTGVTIFCGIITSEQLLF